MNKYFFRVSVGIVIIAVSTLEAFPIISASAQTSTASLNGRLLVDLDHGGYGWYMNPLNHQRYDMSNWEEAQKVMRQFGLGVTDDTLATIPVGVDIEAHDMDSDGDGLPDFYEFALHTDPYNPDTNMDGIPDGTQVAHNVDPITGDLVPVNTKLVNRLKGRILLQVEDNGEAWYLNPTDGKRYYIKEEVNRMDYFNDLGVGVRSATLNAIPVGATIVTL